MDTRSIYDHKSKWRRVDLELKVKKLITGTVIILLTLSYYGIYIHSFFTLGLEKVIKWYIEKSQHIYFKTMFYCLFCKITSKFKISESIVQTNTSVIRQNILWLNELQHLWLNNFSNYCNKIILNSKIPRSTLFPLWYTLEGHNIFTFKFSIFKPYILFRVWWNIAL